MQAALRPYLTAGISLVGASAIAVAPLVAPPAPVDIEVPALRTVASNVALAANPLDFYTQVFSTAAESTGILLNRFIEHPAPLLGQVLTNQVTNTQELLSVLTEYGTGVVERIITEVPAQFQAAIELLGEGDVEGALNTILNIPYSLAGGTSVVSLLGSIADYLVAPLANMEAVINSVASFDGLFAVVGLIGPIMSGFGSVGTAVQNVIDAAGTGDIGEVVNAIAIAPGVVIDGFLNGGYGPGIPFLGRYGGLLSTGEVTGLFAGPFAAVMQIRETIAEAIGWSPSAAFSLFAAAGGPETGPQVTLASSETDEGDQGTSTGDDETQPAEDGAADGEPEAPAGEDTDTAAGSEVDETGEEEVTEPQDSADGTLDEVAEEDAREASDTEEPATEELTDEAEDPADTDSTGPEIRDSLQATPGQTGMDNGAGEGDDGSDAGTDTTTGTAESDSTGDDTDAADGDDSDGSEGSDSGDDSDSGDSSGSGGND